MLLVFAACLWWPPFRTPLLPSLLFCAPFPVAPLLFLYPFPLRAAAFTYFSARGCRLPRLDPLRLVLVPPAACLVVAPRLPSCSRPLLLFVVSCWSIGPPHSPFSKRPLCLRRALLSDVDPSPPGVPLLSAPLLACPGPPSACRRCSLCLYPSLFLFLCEGCPVGSPLPPWRGAPLAPLLTPPPPSPPGAPVFIPPFRWLGRCSPLPRARLCPGGGPCCLVRRPCFLPVLPFPLSPLLSPFFFVPLRLSAPPPFSPLSPLCPPPRSLAPLFPLFWPRPPSPFPPGAVVARGGPPCVLSSLLCCAPFVPSSSPPPAPFLGWGGCGSLFFFRFWS